MKIFKYFTWHFIAFCLAVGVVKADSSPGGKIDTVLIEGLVNDNRQNVIKGIEEKYLELQQMIAGSGEEINERSLSSIFGSSTTLRVFVSSSMSKSLLKAYVNEAKKYKAILIFNGLPDGSWRELSKLVSEIVSPDDEVAIQIDDEAFKRFNVKSVPSFILSKGDRNKWQAESDEDEVYDKASGNIGILGFLRLVSDKGNLSAEANELLKKELKK